MSNVLVLIGPIKEIRSADQYCWKAIGNALGLMIELNQWAYCKKFARSSWTETILVKHSPIIRKVGKAGSHKKPIINF